MKQMKKVILALLVAPLAFTACKKSDTNPAPAGTPVSVTVTPATVNANGGQQLSFAVSTSSTSSIELVTVTQSINGGSATNLQGTPFNPSQTSGTLQYNYNQAYTVPGGVTGTIKLTWTVTDKNNNTNTATATITVGTQGTLGNSSSQTMGDQSSSTGSFYNSSNNTVENQSTATSNPGAVDFVFFTSSSDGAAIGAPSNSDVTATFSSVNGWSVKNTTNFVKLSGFDFNGATFASVVSGYNGGTPSTLAKNLAVGDTYAFYTTGKKYGVFKVTAVTSSTVTFDVKLQQ